MNITQIIIESNKKHSHTSGHIMNAIVDKRNKGSIFDDKLRKKIEKEFQSTVNDRMSEMLCGWGDEWWKD